MESQETALDVNIRANKLKGIGTWRTLYVRFLERLDVDSILELGSGDPSFLASFPASVRRIGLDGNPNLADRYGAVGVEFGCFDFDREEYAGALELVISDWITLKAIGLVTTKMPDGSKGFSLLVIITAEFGTGFQLGFGFTLNGVGGILGLNRIVNIDPLKDGIRTGAIESVMFPENVVANAPRIISDLRQFFPSHQNIFLVGPMPKIGVSGPESQVLRYIGKRPLFR